MSEKIKIAILISGIGSNMESLIIDLKKKDHPGRAHMVISDNPNALGIKRAQQLSIPTFSITPKSKCLDKNDFEKKLLTMLRSNEIQVICLAGFMRILSATFIDSFSGEILNIHPSILPSLKGLNTHYRALKKGIHVHGATVHKVTKNLDSGTILGQTTIKILKDDTPQSLSDRLKPEEHQLYVQVLRNFLLDNSNVIQKII